MMEGEVRGGESCDGEFALAAPGKELRQHREHVIRRR